VHADYVGKTSILILHRKLVCVFSESSHWEPGQLSIVFLFGLFHIFVWYCLEQPDTNWRTLMSWYLFFLVCISVGVCWTSFWISLKVEHWNVPKLDFKFLIFAIVYVTLSRDFFFSDELFWLKLILCWQEIARMQAVVEGNYQENLGGNHISNSFFLLFSKYLIMLSSSSSCFELSLSHFWHSFQFAFPFPFPVSLHFLFLTK